MGVDLREWSLLTQAESPRATPAPLKATHMCLLKALPNPNAPQGEGDWKTLCFIKKAGTKKKVVWSHA